MISQHWISVDKCFLLNLRSRITSEVRETIHHIFVITNCIVKYLLFLVMVLPESCIQSKISHIFEQFRDIKIFLLTFLEGDQMTTVHNLEEEQVKALTKGIGVSYPGCAATAATTLIIG